MTQEIDPFSNGTEYMFWTDENCCKCKKAYWADEMPDFDETQKLIAEGKECPLKFALELHSVCGGLTREIVDRIGYENDRLSWDCKEFEERTIEDDDNPASELPPTS